MKLCEVVRLEHVSRFQQSGDSAAAREGSGALRVVGVEQMAGVRGRARRWASIAGATALSHSRCKWFEYKRLLAD